MFTVLGATGVIGRHLLQSLRAAGEEVFAPQRDDPSLYRRPLGHVIYCIGLTADFRQRPFDTVEAHVSVLARVLQQCSFDSLLYLSSTRVYAGAASSSEDAALCVRPADPSDLYNLSKLMGEALCHATQRSTVRIARLSNVIGGDDADSDNFVPALLREAHSGCILLRSAPTSAKDYIHIDDVVALLPRIARSGSARVYNVASGRQVTHAQWVEHLEALTGCRVEQTPGAPELGFIPIDNSRLRSEFAFAARSPFDALTQVSGSRSSQ